MMIKVLALLLGVLLIGIISPANPAELDLNHLKNAKYFIPSWENPEQGEWVHLHNGEFSRRDPDNFLYVGIVDVALGYLSNHQSKDAAVIYGYNTGGSGFFVMLCAVVNENGKLKNTALVDLEDRVKINSLRIKSGKIIVDMATHGPKDPACCPTVKKIATYALVGNKLEER